MNKSPQKRLPPGRSTEADGSQGLSFAETEEPEQSSGAGEHEGFFGDVEAGSGAGSEVPEDVANSITRNAAQVRRHPTLDRGARRLFQRFHRHEIRARAVAHSCDAVLCEFAHGRSGVADHDVERQWRLLSQPRDQSDIR